MIYQMIYIQLPQQLPLTAGLHSWMHSFCQKQGWFMRPFAQTKACMIRKIVRIQRHFVRVQGSFWGG